MNGQGDRLLIYSIQRCGGLADMGQWVVPVLGHQYRCDFPKQAPLEHAPGGRSSRPPRLPAAQPPPSREAAVTARPVAPSSPPPAPPAAARAILPRAARCRSPALLAARRGSTRSARPPPLPASLPALPSPPLT